ncbi:MAG TPA: helicase-associated domain-containing protein [Chloroflexia bacterium]|jgi:DNA-binding MarR family transcriptional regulator
MKNLLGRLMSRPFEELRVIAATWGTLTRDPNPSQNDLAIAVYHTMMDRSAVRGVWEGISPEERSFIGWLLNQRNMLALADELPAQLDRPPEEVEQLLGRVRRAGLIDVDEALVRGSRVVSSGDNLYAWATRTQPEATRRRVVSISTEGAKVLHEVIEEARQYATTTPFEESFATLLDGLSQEDVQRIATTWKLPEAARYYKSELIGVMGEFLATGQGRELLLTQLPAVSQNLFNYLEGNEGRDTAAGARKHFGWDERELRSALIPLVQRALVWDILAGDRRYLFVPTDLAKNGNSAGASNGAGKTPPYMQPKLEARPPHSAEARLPYEMAWDLLTLLSTAAHGDLQLTLQDSRITKRVAKKINDSFLQPEDLKAGSDYTDMVVHMAQSLGLLVQTSEAENGGQPTLTLTSRADDWARLSFDAQRRRLYGLWQEDRKWSEPATYGTIYWWNSDLTGGRKRLVHHLLELPVGQWTSLDAFLRKIHMTEPFLIWPQDELVRRFGLRALQGFRSQWFEIEGRIIADMLKTMLNWLGAVEIGRDKPKRFISFRVTAEGRALLDPDSASEAAPGPGKTLLVQPNFEVLVLHPDSRVLWKLLRMADLVRHDRVSVYVLNKESVMRAVEAGMSPDEITGFLNTNTGKGLPQNVAHSIADWARMLKRLTVQRVTLIQVDDPAVLDELLASRKTRRMVVLRLSPTTAIANLPDVSESAREDAWQRLTKELRGAGYVPNLLPEQIGTTEDAPARAKPPRGKVAADGAIPPEPGRPRTRARTPRTTTSTTRRTGTS